MGNLIDSGLHSGMTWLNVGNGQQASIRFTAQKSGTVTKIMTYGFNYNGTAKVIIGLQGDSSGNPSGSWLGGTNDFGEVAAPTNGAFISYNLTSPVSLTSGQVYHLVIEPAQDTRGFFALTVYPAICHCQPLNFTDPDLNWKDDAINTLSYSNSTWTVQNKYPVFTIVFSNGSAMGQPYSLAAPWVIWGKTVVGEAVIPTSTYNLGKVSFVLTKLQTPKDNLYYAIYDSANTVLVSGTLATPQNFSNGYNVWVWMSVTLPHTVTLNAGQLYRVVLSSPNNDLNDAYQLIGLEFSSNYSIGYGGLQDTLVTSLDGGLTWGTWFDADAMFQLTTSS